jgi:formylglycine-generating enzyme required for sulfatase activity
MKIFISYRRAEDNKSYIVGTIHERLSNVFGKENVFRDTYDITAGSEWRGRLDNEVNSCKVMLVVIGPDWANLAYPNGQKRLFDPEDVTRWEIESGLRRSRDEGISLIPILVTGAGFPQIHDLPETLHDLLNKQAILLRNFPDFDVDMERLIHDIRKLRGFREDDLKLVKDYEPKTVYIAEGSFCMGSQPGEGIPTHETPQHEVFLPAFRIGKYPVTNKEYEAYIRQKGISIPRQMGWEGQKIREGREEYPVVGVTWIEAMAYCRWLSEQTGREYVLPNEAQWEKACRGGSNSFFPWGNEMDLRRCNHNQAEIAGVRAYLEQNDFGCYDFVGNIRQWTSTLWGTEEIAPDPRFAYPWRDDGRNNLEESRLIWRVMRGSSFMDEQRLLRSSSRGGDFPESRGFPGWRYGFRVAMKVD